MEATSEPFVPQVPGRNCADCAMCCKLLEIPELEKPYNAWCTHCLDKASCSIHATRPQRCRDFYCYFLGSKLGEEWRPSKCRFILTTHEDRMLIMVDPARPDSWRKEPYFSFIRNWAAQTNVYAMVGTKTYAIFPDHVDDLGEVTDDHQIMITEEMTASGPRRKAIRVLKSEVRQ